MTTEIQPPARTMRVLPASYNLGDSRMFTIEVSHLAGGSVRRSVKEMLVSYSSLTAVLQNIKNSGAKILSITPHQQPITNSHSSPKATVTEAPAPAAKDHDKNQSKLGGTPIRFRIANYLKSNPPNGKRVTRPSRWGNPYRVGKEAVDAAEAVALFRDHLKRHPALVELAKRELSGFNLGCTCPLDQPCHADVWLEVVNS